MDLIFFGSGAFGIPTLERLSREHRIGMIVTQPDRAAGRGGGMTPTPVAMWAAKHLPGARILKPEKVNEAGVVAEIREVAADAFVVIAFGQKMGKALLDGVLAINLHASLLPRWRGAAPINAAMLAGDTITGNSVITLADRMDAGLVLGQTRRPISPEWTAGELHDLLAGDGPDLVMQVLDGHARGSLTPVVQDETRVTLAGKFSRADAWVDFSRNARECLHRIHGLTPWPGVMVTMKGEGAPVELKLLRVQASELDPERGGVGETGHAVLINPTMGLLLCGDGSALRLVEVQPPGKKPMQWDEYIRGRRLHGTICVSSNIPPKSFTSDGQ